MSESPPAAAKVDPVAAHISADWQYDSPLISCRFDPQGRFIFSTAENNRVQRWNLADGKATALEGHESWPWTIGFSPDGETTYTSGADGRLIFWPTAADAPKPLRAIDAHHGWARCLAVSPDGKLIATGGNDRRVKLWNAADGALVHELVKHEVPVYSVLFHPAANCLLSGDLRGNVHQWGLEKGEWQRSFDAKKLYTENKGQNAEYGGVRTMAISADGKSFACGGTFNASNPFGAVCEPLALRFEWESQKIVQSHIAKDLKGPLWRVVFHPDGFLIGICGGSGAKHILFWKADQEGDFHRFDVVALPRDMDLDPRGMRLASAHYDRHLRITTLAAKAT
ncbi:MAG: hypothetical protein IT427_19885 [Pirellulales bacterium]|nr:hypothetical protein [Pirellulales bacterium]